MSRYLNIRIGPVEWSDQKLKMEMRDISVDMRQRGAGNVTVTIEGEEPPQKLYLHLGCKPCKTHWYAEQFSPCEQCGQKVTVKKLEPGRVPMPEEKPEADEPEPEKTEEPEGEGEESRVVKEEG